MFLKTFKLLIIFICITAYCHAQTEQTYTVCNRQKVFVNDLLAPPISENSNNACTAIIRTVSPTSGVSDYGNGYFVFYDTNKTFTITSQRVPSSDTDGCDAGPKVKQTIQVIVEDCTSKPLKEVEESADQIFKDYPRLLEIVDGNDCANEQVTVHRSGNGNIYYEYEDATNKMIFSSGGNFLCLYRPNETPCSNIYDFTEVLTTWACANQPAIEGCTNETACNYNPKAVSDNGTCFLRSANKSCLDQCYPPAFIAKFGCTDPAATNYFADAFCDDGSCVFEGEATIFDRYPYLLDYVDPTNCNSEKITVYNFVIGIEVLLEVDEGSYVFYSTGAAACSPQDEAILGESCIDFLFRDTSNVVETWECGGANTFNETIDDIIKSKSELSFFSIATTSYAQDLSVEGPFTVFAPTNNALTTVYPNIAIFGFIDPPTSYVETINNHVVEGVYSSADLFDGQILISISGVPLFVTINENGIFINDAQVTGADFETTNGVVHIVDKVLLIENIPGCNNPKAVNYNPEATEDDGSCDFDLPTTEISSELYNEFPWLSNIIDPENCSGSTVTVYDEFFWNFIFVENSDGAILYYEDGTLYCTNSNSRDCRDLYNLSSNATIFTCGDSAQPERRTVVDVIVESEVHSTLENAVITAGLAETLSGEGPFTVFAPTDDAFRALPPASLGALFVNTSGGLTDLLLYHVLEANILSSDLSNDQVATTLAGVDIRVSISDAGILINDALVTIADIETDNGVVHVIDAVLLPPPPKQATVFDIIANSVEHNILEESIKSAGLSSTLSSEGPFTVFAPTDEAFAAIPQEVLTPLLSDPTGDLTQILLYHVLGLQVESTSLTNRQIATTLNGAGIEVTINANGIFINDAKVTIADIVTDNGLVHVIDAVLLPPTKTSNPVFEDFPWLGSIVDVADCNGTSATVYDLGAFQYVYVESTNGGTLYFEDGTRYCTDRAGLSCRTFYGLNESTAAYNCGDEVEQPDQEPSSEIFNEFSWLSNIIDESNCDGITAKVYNEGAFQYVFVESPDGGTLYFEDGTRYCGNRANLNCEEFYGLEEVASTYVCEGGNFVINQKDETVRSSNAHLTKNKFIETTFDIKLYPNPTNNYLLVEFMELLQKELAITLYDVSGKVVETFTTLGNFKLDLTTQTNGMYLLELRNDDNIQQHKVMKY